MMNWIKNAFDYIGTMWSGIDGKPSLTRVLALCFGIDLMINIHNSILSLYHVVKLYEIGKNIESEVVTQIVLGMGQAALILGIEAGLITALLGLTSYTKIQEKKIDNQTTE